MNVFFQVFELGRHLKQSGLDNKENVPWDGGRANPAALEVVRHLVHEIHIITHEAHRLEGLFLPLQLGVSPAFAVFVSHYLSLYPQAAFQHQGIVCAC